MLTERDHQQILGFQEVNNVTRLEAYRHKRDAYDRMTSEALCRVTESVIANGSLITIEQAESLQRTVARVIAGHCAGGYSEHSIEAAVQAATNQAQQWAGRA
jgi:hypothetical protein